MSWTAGPIFPAYLNPSITNGTTCSHRASSDTTLVPSGQRDESASVIFTSGKTGFVTLAVVGLRVSLRVGLVVGGESMHSQTDGLVMGVSTRMMISFEGHKYSKWSGLNCNLLFPLL